MRISDISKSSSEKENLEKMMLPKRFHFQGFSHPSIYLIITQLSITSPSSFFVLDIFFDFVCFLSLQGQ